MIANVKIKWMIKTFQISNIKLPWMNSVAMKLMINQNIYQYMNQLHQKG